MDKLSILLYTEIDISCILLLGYILLRSFGHVEKRQSWYFFQFSIGFIILFIVSDLSWFWMENGILPMTRRLAYFVNWSYFLYSIAGIAAWFFYTECELETHVFKKKHYVVFASVPLILTVATLVLNSYNHCLFYFDEQGAYRRGPLNVITFLIPCLYLGFCVIHSLKKAFQKESYAKQKSYLSLACFGLPTAIAALLQIVTEGTPLPCIGFCASVLLVYMTSQELLISIDPLTKLNNRNHMIRYLGSRIEHYDSSSHLYLLLLDLDHFKQVNDTYGHLEGDRALVRFAGVLRETASVFGCFAARYGGDEFILIYETDEEKNVQMLCEFIHEKLADSCLEGHCEYDLGTSIGCAEYSKEIRYVQTFIERADQALYRVKLNRPVIERTEI